MIEIYNEEIRDLLYDAPNAGIILNSTINRTLTFVPYDFECLNQLYDSPYDAPNADVSDAQGGFASGMDGSQIGHFFHQQDAGGRAGQYRSGRLDGERDEAPHQVGIEIRRDVNGRLVLPGLNSVVVRTASDAMEVFESGMQVSDDC